MHVCARRGGGIAEIQALGAAATEVCAEAQSHSQPSGALACGQAGMLLPRHCRGRHMLPLARS